MKRVGKTRCLAVISLCGAGFVTACGPSSNIEKYDNISFSSVDNDKRITEWDQKNSKESLSWSNCLPDKIGNIEGLDKLSCATVKSPVDWFNQDGDTTKIPIIKLPSRSKDPKGDIIVNPGGPGSSGTEQVLGYAMDDRMDRLRDAYNIIGLDPRGVSGVVPGGSPLLCPEEALLPVPCEESDILENHSSTTEVAYDMEYVRRLLGDESMNYFGTSYGTYLGSIYATLFPEKVGRFVLDGPTTRSQYLPKGKETESDFLDFAVDRFFQACANGEIGECKLGKTLSEVASNFDKEKYMVSEKLDYSASDDSDSIDPLSMYLYTSMYGDSSTWENTLKTINGAIKGNEEDLKIVSDSTVEVLEVYNNSVICAVEDAAGCDSSSNAITDPQVNYSGSFPALIVAVSGDPATPYRYAEEFKDDMGNASLLTVIGNGHGGSYGQSQCASDAVDEYFVNSVVPTNGTMCTGYE